MVTVLKGTGCVGCGRGMALCSVVMGQCMRWVGQEWVGLKPHAQSVMTSIEVATYFIFFAANLCCTTNGCMDVCVCKHTHARMHTHRASGGVASTTGRVP